MTEQIRFLSWPRRIIRWFLTLIVTLFFLVILYFGYQLWLNNRSVDAPSHQLVSASLEKSIRWLMANRDSILDVENPMLWWFLKESADITRDVRLNELFSNYKKRYLDPNPRNVWWHLFDTNSKAPITMWQLEQLPDYNLYFIFGATCDPVLGKEINIRHQNDPALCAYHHLRSSCVTHQLMGARFAQRRNCYISEISNELVLALQKKIVSQLVWDPRVMDVYTQRVMLLAESGASESIKPVWLQRILDAQLSDGSWGDFYPVIPVGRGYHVGFVWRGLVVKQSKGDFHATAQGILLMSLVTSGSHVRLAN